MSEQPKTSADSSPSTGISSHRSTAPSTLAHDEYLGLRRFAPLDGLRAIAVLLVFLAHPAYPGWSHLHGKSGVTLFFLLSGFLITTLGLREEDKKGRVSMGAFYIRRTFRIIPLYALVLLLYCVLILGLGFESGRRNLFAEEVPYYSLGFPEHAIFYAPAIPPFDGAWSIGIEEKFYLVWPILAFAALGPLVLRSRFAPRITACAVIVIAATLPGFSWAHGDVFAPYAQLALGCAIALLLHQPAWYERMRLLGRAVPLTLLTVAFLAVQFGVPGTTLGSSGYLLYGFVTALLLGSLVVTKLAPGAWLGTRPLAFVAGVSYAMYLTHNFVINLVESAVPSSATLGGTLIATPIALGLSLLVAWFFSASFEQPLTRLGRRLSVTYSGRRVARRQRVGAADTRAS